MSFIAGTRITSGTGGITTSITGYTVHIFSTPGAATFVPRGSGAIEVLVVGAGGGGGGTTGGGGAGGGAVIYNKFVNVTSGTSYPITVGLMGELNTNGGFSSYGAIIANGGGGGGAGGTGNPSPQASGGGARGNVPDPYQGGVGAGITGLGFPGGNNPGSAGGGGAGGAGSPGGIGGTGGIGLYYSITGTSQYYGAGGTGSISGGRGVPGGGYGGGGGSDQPTLGFPGVVIIRYPS